MSKYKYYFKKPKSEIAKDVLKALAISGAIAVAATSPYFGTNLLKSFKNKKKYSKRKVYDVFYNLQRYGYINFEKRNHQLYMTLTDKGRRIAGIFQIDDLKIKVPRKWDRKWRLVIFDISELKRTKRELFRSKLKQLGFKPLQKSVWACPYECKDEIELLREFFGLSKKEICLIVTDSIEDDSFLRKAFRLN